MAIEVKFITKSRPGVYEMLRDPQKGQEREVDTDIPDSAASGSENAINNLPHFIHLQSSMGPSF